MSIFTRVANVNPPRHKLGRRDRKRSTLGWIRLSHVNRQWRHICVNTPDLWARHIGVFPNFSAGQEFIARTGTTVLVDICVKRGNALRLDTFFDALVLDELLTRIKTLTWCTPSLFSIWRIRTKLRSVALPSLKSLDLEYETSTALNVVSRLDGNPADLPSLVSATFTRCFFRFLAPALTRLKLTAIDISCTDLFDILQWTPLLTLLYLSSCSLSGDISDCEIVPVPHLAQLKLFRGEDDDTPRLFKDLVEHLSMPPHTLFRIEYYTESCDIEDLDFITPVIRTISCEYPPCGIQFGIWTLKLHSGHLPSPLDMSLASPFSHVVGENTTRAEFGLGSYDQFASWLNTNVAAVHAELACITTFSADMSLFGIEGWIVVLRALPNLRVLHLIRSKRLEWCYVNMDVRESHRDGGGPDEDKLAEDVFTALAATVDTPSNTSSIAFAPQVVVPQLDLIWLTRDCKEVRQGDIDEPQLLKHMAQATTSRAKLNANTLSTLRLDIITEPKKRQRGVAHARILRKLVKDIRWSA